MDQTGDNDGIDWTEEGVPVARRFDDPYFSRKGGLAEARHVFLAGNGLPERFHAGFHIAELGFGTGLNMLATWAAWRAAGMRGDLHYTGFEAWPLTAEQIERALAPFPEIAELAALFRAGWSGGAGPVALPGLRLEIVAGDARVTLPQWRGRADAWFLDGFAPARNPELWEPALMAEVADHTAPGGSFATYTAAGAVRRALAGAGFNVSRLPGFAGKRHMSAGRLV
ncbi:FAD-dependent oxidoreductase [Rhodobacteraceae bacterium WD3A24]|nr:FAD-dependent oxidoreductase [Rhodobacteraceae bacterium WD3A24]